MVTFRYNNSKRNFRRNGRSDRGFKSNNNDRGKFSSNFSNNENFQRKIPGRNNHNAPKLIEKYNNLAREALSVGDKILSENYFQHADHFTRILNEQEIMKKSRNSTTSYNIKEMEETSNKEIEETSNKEEKSFSDTEKSNDIQSEAN